MPETGEHQAISNTTETNKLVKEIHKALVGDIKEPDKPGFIEQLRDGLKRLGKLEKIVYGFIGLILTAFAGGLIHLVMQ